MMKNVKKHAIIDAKEEKILKTRVLIGEKNESNINIYFITNLSRNLLFNL